MMTMNDYEFLQRIKQENEDAKAHRRIVARHRTREERKRRRIAILVALAAISVVTVCVAVALDNSGDDPTRELPLKTTSVMIPEPVKNGMDVLGEFAIVAYCSCEKCCGDWALNRPMDDNGEEIVYTASGARAEAGVTVAVDPEIIPLGTEVYIDGMGWYVAQDTGSFTGKVVDVYFNDHAAACEFGRTDATVAILEVEANG